MAGQQRGIPPHRKLGNPTAPASDSRPARQIGSGPHRNKSKANQQSDQQSAVALSSTQTVQQVNMPSMDKATGLQHRQANNVPTKTANEAQIQKRTTGTWAERAAGTAVQQPSPMNETPAKNTDTSHHAQVEDSWKVTPNDPWSQPLAGSSWTAQPTNIWTDQPSNIWTDQPANTAWTEHVDDQKKDCVTSTQAHGDAAKNTTPWVNIPHVPQDNFKQQHNRFSKGKDNRKQSPWARKKKKKESPWIKNSEIPKKNSVLSFVEQKYDYGGPPDPNLFWAWEGEHAAPPIWTERLPYKNPDLHGSIESWQSKVITEKNPLGSTKPNPANSKGADFSFVVGASNAKGGRLYFTPPKQDEQLMAELVPRAWIPTILEPKQSLEGFWEDQIREAPKPQDESDLADCKPFWELYLSPNSAAQPLPVHPEHRGCDTSEDSPEDRKGREQDKGSQGWTNQYLRNPNGFMKARFGIKSAYRGKCVEVEEVDTTSLPKADALPPIPFIDTTIRPKLNVLVRMAQPVDIPQITNIYNHYVQSGFCVPELEAIKKDVIKDRFESVREVHLPFIVCCSRNGGKGRKFNSRASTEQILGFAFADDYNGPRSALRFTVEVGVFVAPNNKRGGVSKCLLDKLMGLLDQYYTERGGYDVDEMLGIGIHRLVSRMVLNWMHASDDKAKEWLIPYLESWGFKQCGHLPGVGYKLNQIVDLITFCRNAGLVIVPTNPPPLPPLES